jgi:hypothetical protein
MMQWILLSVRNITLDRAVKSLNAYDSISDPVSSSSVPRVSSSPSLECDLLRETGKSRHFPLLRLATFRQRRCPLLAPLADLKDVKLYFTVI